MKTPRIPSHLTRKPLCAAVLSGLVTVSAPTLVAVAASTANPCAARRNTVLAQACKPCSPCATKRACNPCNPCNPCAVKKKACNPCNPCAAKGACNPCNPCAAKRACSPCNPCNPCAARGACSPCNPCNPCAAKKVSAKDFMRPKGAKLAKGKKSKLVAEGKRLWHDKRLSTNDLSCSSCHANNASLNASFAKPYPHRVAMPSQMAGVGKITADEMAQFCLLVPMQSKTLPWDSMELAALAAYTVELQKNFKYNPCAARNPCNPCNPCAARKACNPCNPCAARKPCSPCNPCAARKACNPCNPCASRKNPCSPCNPCNPCAVKKGS